VVLLTRDMRADASSCTQGPKRPLSMASSCSVTTFWGHSTAIASHLVVSRPWCSAVGRSVRKRVAERNRDTSRLPPLGLLHACWSVARCHWLLLSDGLLVHAHAWRWACAHGWHTCMYMARSDDGLLDGIVEISRLALGQRPTEDDGGLGQLPCNMDCGPQDSQPRSTPVFSLAGWSPRPPPRPSTPVVSARLAVAHEHSCRGPPVGRRLSLPWTPS